MMTIQKMQRRLKMLRLILPVQHREAMTTKMLLMTCLFFHGYP